MDELERSPSALPLRLKEVVERAAAGLSDRQIAAELGISPHTVEGHWKRLRVLFDASNRTEIVARYLRGDILGGPDQDAPLVARMAREIAAHRETEARLAKALAERDEAIRERDRALSNALVRNIYRERRLDWLETVERAVENAGVVVYHGEYGGAWRKFAITQSFGLLGHSADDFVSGKLPIWDLMPHEDTAELNLAFAEIMSRKPRRVVMEYRMRSTTGTLQWFRDHVSIRWDAEGNPVDYTGVAFNIDDLVGDGPYKARTVLLPD